MNGWIMRVVVIGHGMAAVTGRAIACATERYLEGNPVKVDAKIASELNIQQVIGFHLPL